MSESLLSEVPEGNEATAVAPAEQQAIGKITVFEALAEPAEYVGVSRSNQTTPSAADADDQ